MGAINRLITQRVAWLELDVLDAPVNKITRSIREELREHLEWLCGDEEVQAAILISRKVDQFIAGTDVDEFASVTTRAEALKLVRDGQALVTRFETIGKPIVAAIHGPCVGGGLEAALACTYRVATDHPRTLLRLPEVRIGIIPAAGGCQRLPRLVGLRNALPMILTGRAVSAEQAHSIGLVDDLVHPSILDEVALKAALRLASGWRPKRSGNRLIRLATDKNQLARKAIFAKAKKNSLSKTRGHYPAPLAALDAVSHGLQYGLDAGLEHEAAHFSELAIGQVSRNLVRIFFAGIALKKEIPIESDDSPARPVQNVAVVGSGFMGSAIAGVAVTRSAVDVRLQDKDIDNVVRGLRAARETVRGESKRNRTSEHQQRRMELLLSGGLDWAGFGRADLVVEAVSENLEVKRSVVDDIESHVGADCIIASNTSTIEIARLAKTARHPERIIGLHFLSPVEKVPLVEVVAHERTAPWVVAASAAFGRKLNKTVIIVKDAPGFWVNRILAPYLYETWTLLGEGVSGDEIDSIMMEFGFPVGPVTLLDEVGLDVVRDSLRSLSQSFSGRFDAIAGLDRLVSEGRLGRKSGSGLYEYRRGKKRRFDESVVEVIGVASTNMPPADEIELRLVYSMLNEAARALGEGVVRSPRDGDMGAIYGIGFPPFRGGPFRFMDHIGSTECVARLEDLKEQCGDRFTPAMLLTSMVAREETFYEQHH